MASGDDGQYELVLENRQVLAIFLFAALLCGVFFGLGYIVGSNSKPSVANPLTAQATPAGKSDRKSSALSPVEQANPPVDTTPQPAPVETQPAPVTAAPVETKPVESKPVEAKPVVTKPVPPPERPVERPKPAPEPAKPVAAPPAVAADATNVMLQAVAVTKEEDAAAVAALLRRKNYPASVVTSTSDGLYRVQVGPYPTLREAEIARRGLETEGFKPIVKR